MKIIVVFTKGGVPQEGLLPTIDIYTIDGTKVIDAEAMTEIAIGGYYYDFTSYDYSQDYLIRCDGGSSLGGDRYIYLTNEASSINYDLNNGNWVIENNQMIMYNSQNQEIVRYNLYDGNNQASMNEVFKRVKV